MHYLKMLILIVLFHSNTIGQLEVKPLMGVKGFGTLLDNTITVQGITFSPGVEINKRINTGLNFSKFSSKGPVNASSADGTMSGWITSGFFGYHLTEPISNFSPMAEIVVGGVFHTDQKNTTEHSGHTFQMGTTQYRFFSRAKLLLDIQFERMSVRFGTTFNVFELRAFYPESQRYESNMVAGFGIELGTTFLLGKRTLH